MIYYTVSEELVDRNFKRTLVSDGYLIDRALYTKKEAINRIAQYYKDFYPNMLRPKERRINKAEAVLEKAVYLGLMYEVSIKKSHVFWFFGERFRFNDARCSKCPYLRRENGYMFCKDSLNEISEIRTDACPV